MVAIFRWSGRWKRKQEWLNLSSCFQLVLILWIVSGAVFNLVVLAQEVQTNSTSISTNSTNLTREDDSGEWEYYYLDDEDEPSNNTSSPSPPAESRTDFPNSTIHGDDYYYYLEETVVKPKNGSAQGKTIKTTKLKIEGTRKGRNRYNDFADSLKSASAEHLRLGTSGFGGGRGGGIIPLPSVEPFKELATPLKVDGPEFTDNNYGHYYHYQTGNPDVAVGKPLGEGEYPSNPFKEEGEPLLLRPPPPHATQPPAESGLELDVVNHAESIDSTGPFFDNSGSLEPVNGGIFEPVNDGIFDDAIKSNHVHPGFLLPNLHTNLKVEAYGSIAPEKNPILKAKEFFHYLWEIIAHISKSEMVLWTEKAFNLVSELSIPQEHYLRVISFAGIYLFIAMLTYGAEDVVEIMCTVETKDKPFKHWNHHAARRFVPARSVDPHLQERFLKLFRGEDDDDDDEESDISSNSRSNEEDIADELDHISELCPEDAFFYSLNPKHIEAYTLLQNILVAQESPKKFLRLAKRLLHKEKVHPKVWYFAIIGSFLARQDLTGFSVAHPLDAIPDWYIPEDLLSNEKRNYRKIRIKRSIKSNVTSSKAVATIHFSQEETSLEGLPLNLPVKSDKGNFTVSIVMSKKKENVTNTSSASESSSAPIPSSEEISSSNSIEPREEILTKVKTDHGKKTKGKAKPMLKVTNKQQVKGAKGDKGDIIVKGNKSKGSGKDNEYPLDSRHQGRRGKKGKKKKKCIKVNWKVGLDNGVENELWYWREDMMMNQHHWYWHQTHPINSSMHADRRAELFFYMHRTLVARYNAERLSNGLKRVRPLDFRGRGVIYSGYNPHLADINSGIVWAPRWPNTPISDIFHDHDPDFALNITLAYYNTLCERLVKAIKTGKIIHGIGPPVPIGHSKGIELLTNTIEATDLSVNPMYYDTTGIHALGHIMVGLAADPDFRFRSASGVMADAAVSMRDPAFYSYHLFMDNIFELHKERLPPYSVVGGEFPLLWKGVRIAKVQLISQGGPPKNELRTFWTHHKFELSPGVDRSIKKGKKHAEVCAQHLDHEPFYFKIVIDRQPCVKSKSGQGMVRIFMAPRYDEKGRRIPLKIQRRLMFPLDSFPVKLKPGRNTITRYAEDSSMTQPWTKSFRDFERGPDPSGAADFCGCGWPQHLYIPKGHVAGMAFDLFVMVTNYDEDHVPNDPKMLEIPETCNSPYIFCGLPRRKYPDRRPMGYPFDRPLFKSFNCPPGWTFSSVLCKSLNLVINKPLDFLEEYVSKAPNMAMLKFHIRHLDTFLPEPARHR